MRYVPVHGTSDVRPTSWWRGGLLVELLAEHGLTRVLPTFEWSGDLDGVFWDNGRDWPAGAKSLWYYLRPLQFRDRNVIAHSHGGAIALLCAEQLPIRTLITVGTPVRKAVKEAGRKALAKGHIQQWHHVYDKSGDRMQWLGQLFDGRWFGSRAFELDGMTDHGLKGISHSRILYEPAHFGVWNDEGLITALTGEVVSAA